MPDSVTSVQCVDPLTSLDRDRCDRGRMGSEEQVLPLVAAAWAALGGKAPERPDRRTLLEYVVLVAALTALATIPVPVTALD